MEHPIVFPLISILRFGSVGTLIPICSINPSHMYIAANIATYAVDDLGVSLYV